MAAFRKPEAASFFALRDCHRDWSSM